jgi:preprotein translocase subunit Sec61beta
MYLHIAHGYPWRAKRFYIIRISFHPMKQERVSMPMASAGIIGFSPDTRISGMEIDPKFLIVGVFIMVVLVHLLALAINY